MSESARREQAVIQSMIPQLEADGFSVLVNPTKEFLPPFLSGFRPDAIALGPDRKILIEVFTRFGDEAKAKAERLQMLVKAHPDWELRVVYAPESSDSAPLPVFPKSLLAKQISDLESSFDQIDRKAALLISWAVFEAVARRLAPDSFARPQIPARLIEVLASAGDVTFEEADALRMIGQIRNEVAHGKLDQEPSEQDLRKLIGITQRVLALVA